MPTTVWGLGLEGVRVAEKANFPLKTVTEVTSATAVRLPSIQSSCFHINCILKRQS